LPAADELRRVPVQRPEPLLTVGPGLATAPPQLTLDDAKDGRAGGPGQKLEAESQKPATGEQKAAPDVARGDDALRAPRSGLRTS